MTYIPLHRDTERWQWRYAEAVRQFQCKEISEAVFGATLYSLGFRGAGIQSEINLAYEGEWVIAPKVDLNKFVSGLA